MVSPNALARKQRFLSLKEEHSDIQGVQDYIKSLKWNIWYDDAGTIISASKTANVDLDNKYNKAEFTDEQVEIVKTVNNSSSSMNWGGYKVTVDKFDSSVKYLEVKTIEKSNISENIYLVLVQEKKTSQYNLKIKINKNRLMVSLHKNLIEQYNRVGIENAVIKGRTLIPFYFTSKNDPSFLIYKTSVKLRELISSPVHTIEIPKNLELCSIYTTNLFETYIRE